jgi:hypothetical protein
MSKIGSAVSLVAALVSTQLILFSASGYLGITPTVQDSSWLVVITSDEPSLKCWFNLETLTAQLEDGPSKTASYAADDCGGTIMCSTCGRSFENIMLNLQFAYVSGSLAMICCGLRMRSMYVQKQQHGNWGISYACLAFCLVYLTMLVCSAVSLSVCSQTIHEVLDEPVSLATGALAAFVGAALMAAVAGENMLALVVGGQQQS